MFHVCGTSRSKIPRNEYIQNTLKKCWYENAICGMTGLKCMDVKFILILQRNVKVKLKNIMLKRDDHHKRET